MGGLHVKKFRRWYLVQKHFLQVNLMEIFTFHLISVSLGIDDDLFIFFNLIFYLSIILLQSKEILYSTLLLMMLSHHVREMTNSEIQKKYVQFSFDAVFSCSRTIILMQFDPSYDASESD